MTPCTGLMGKRCTCGELHGRDYSDQPEPWDRWTDTTPPIHWGEYAVGIAIFVAIVIVAIALLALYLAGPQ
jgi:hypothetical protein